MKLEKNIYIITIFKQKEGESNRLNSEQSKPMLELRMLNLDTCMLLQIHLSWVVGSRPIVRLWDLGL